MNKNKIFTVNIDVRFRDLDAMGHVNNAVYFTYFEEGRKNFSHAVFKLSDPSEFRFILAHIRCNYLMPVKLNNGLTLHMQVKKIGNKSFDYVYRLTDRSDESIVYATGESVQVCYDYEKNQSMTVPDGLRDQLSTYLKS